MTIPTFLITFYDYSNDINNDFMIRIIAKIGPVVLKEIIEYCIIQSGTPWSTIAIFESKRYS